MTFEILFHSLTVFLVQMYLYSVWVAEQIPYLVLQDINKSCNPERYASCKEYEGIFTVFTRDVVGLDVANMCQGNRATKPGNNYLLISYR